MLEQYRFLMLHEKQSILTEKKSSSCTIVYKRNSLYYIFFAISLKASPAISKAVSISAAL